MAGKLGMKGGGGARAGAGRKKTPPVLFDAPPASTSPQLPDSNTNEPDSIRVLRAITNNTSLDAKLRLDAAKALAPYEAQRKGEGGKKDERGAAAKRAAGGKFAPAAPPKLVVSNK